MSQPNKKVFISYAHKDSDFFQVFKDGLKSHLYNSNKFNFGTWEDSEIHVGSFWDDEIQKNISETDIAILCVSAHFLNSSYIEAKEFGVLIAKFPNTLIVPVYFNHCNIRAWDELSKRQFFKPSGYKYDKAAKEDFAFCDLVMFTQTDGRPLPNSNIQLYLNDFVEKVETAIDQQNELKQPDSNKVETIKRKSYSLTPKPTNLFTGRRKELADFKDKFNNSNILCIVGLGGIGKSEFAARVIEDLDKSKVVWFDCKPDSSFESLIECTGYHDLLQIGNTTDVAFFLGYRDLLERDEKIVFLDNYHDLPTNNEFDSFFKYLKNNLQSVKFILIAREKITFDDIDITQFPIVGLMENSVEYAKKIIDKNYSDSIVISDDKLKIICDDHLLGHPFAIQLAIQLISYEGNDTNIIEIISTHSLEREKLSNRLLDEIFNHPKSTPEERKLLIRMSVFQRAIEKSALEHIYGIEYKEPLKNLINKLMVTQKEGTYILHPLVRQFSYLRLINKTEIHDLALKYFLLKNKGELELIIQEEIFFHSQNSENYEFTKEFIEQNGEILLDYGFNKLVKNNIDWLFAREIKTQKLVIINTDVSLRFGTNLKEGLKLISEAFALPEQSKELSLEAKITQAELAQATGDLANVVEEYTELIDECELAGFKKGQVVCLSQIASYYNHTKELSYAESTGLKALKIHQEIDYYRGLQLTHEILGYTFYLRGKFDRAKEQFLKLSENAKKVNNIRDINSAQNGLALVYSGLGKDKEALEIFKNNLSNSIKIGDKNSQAMDSYNIASTLFTLKTEPYLEYITLSLKIRTELSDYLNIGKCYDFFGKHYFGIGNLPESLKAYLISFSYLVKTQIKSGLDFAPLREIKKKLGGEEYLVLLNSIYNSLNSEEKENIPIDDVKFQPLISEKVPGRNDLCPCGNGKKYKYCHGKS